MNGSNEYPVVDELSLQQERVRCASNDRNDILMSHRFVVSLVDPIGRRCYSQSSHKSAA